MLRQENIWTIDICLGVPAIIGKNGVEKIVEIEID